MAGKDLACATRSLLAACARNSLWQRSLDLLFQLPASSVHANTWNFNLTITACAKASQWMRALDILARFFTLALRPSLVSFNAAMAACQHGRTWIAVLDLFQNIVIARLQPDNISLGFAVNACRASHRWQQSFDILRAFPIRLDTQYSQAVAALNATISACEKGREWEQALAVLANMERQGPQPDVISYNSTITACEKGQHWERSIQLFAMLQKSFLKPDTISFNAAIASCDKGQQWSRALQLLSEMRHMMHSPTVVTCTATVTVLGRGQQPSLAASCLEEMRYDTLKPTSILYGAILGACMAGQDWVLALTMLRAMQLDLVTVDPLCLSSAVFALVSAGQFHHFYSFSNTCCYYGLHWLSKTLSDCLALSNEFDRSSRQDPTDYAALLVISLDLFPSLGLNQNIVIEIVGWRWLLKRLLLFFSKLSHSSRSISGSGALQRPFSLGSHFTVQALEHLRMEANNDDIGILVRRSLSKFTVDASIDAGHSYSIRCSSSAGGNWGSGVSERELSVWLGFHMVLQRQGIDIASGSDGYMIGYGGNEK